MKKVLLLDIENIHKTEKELLHLLKTYACVYLVYAKSPVTLSLDALVKFSPFVMEKKLVVIKMPKIGKDAADFGLAFLAGQLSIQMDKKNTCFDVMSNDGALEYIVDLLIIMGFQATQVKTSKETKITDLKNTKTDVKIAECSALQDKDQIQQATLKQLVRTLLKIKNTPSDRQKLHNGIKSWANVNDKEADHFIKILLDLQLIQINTQSIVFQQEKLRKFLQSSHVAITENGLVEFPDVKDILEKLHLKHLKEYCDYLVKQQGKPTTATSLKNSIKNVLHLESVSIVKNRYKLLIRYAILKELSNGEIEYNQKHIRQWANLSLKHDNVEDTNDNRSLLIHQMFKILGEIKIQKLTAINKAQSYFDLTET